MTNTMEKVVRIAKFIACFAIAVIVVWRGNVYNDPHCPSALPQIMCAVFAITITFTGFALANDKTS